MLKLWSHFVYIVMYVSLPTALSLPLLFLEVVQIFFSLIAFQFWNVFKYGGFWLIGSPVNWGSRLFEENLGEQK
jgi:hypothetical protein